MIDVSCKKEIRKTAVSRLISRVTYCQFRRYHRPLQFGHSEEKEKEDQLIHGRSRA